MTAISICESIFYDRFALPIAKILCNETLEWTRNST